MEETISSITKHGMERVPTALWGDGDAAGQDGVLLISTPTSPGAAEMSMLVFCSRHSSAGAWHLGGSLHSLCHSAFCQHSPWQPGLKPAEGEPLKAARAQPWVH